ncbi:CPBP family intramembrane glutamic endopeptidase [Clostridium scatologenes]|uniref:Caax amino protease family n=1 Tax=Clostridium scatologenes TaxID=1548 RepID=A0A0E3M761_CLOSL|nr:CPBP family intramembrane glutamic endopeptidase [Clostridium scatologenes]AKA70409.1 caax amino protease family [Clostridium scatologenes]
MRVFKGIHNYLQKLSTIKFIITIVLLMYLLIIPFIPLSHLYQKNIGQIGGPFSINTSLAYEIIVGSILSPILETAIFQYAIIEFLSSINILKGKSILIIIISAVLFGIPHSYSYIYIFYGFIMGLLLAYSYLTYKSKNFSAFWVVFWIHCIRNTISTIFIIFYH